MTLLKAHHVQIMIPRGREDEAREFYSEILGISEIPKPDSLLGRGGFWLDLDGFQIHVGVGGDNKPADSREHIAFLVEDVDHWRTRLADRGIESSAGTSIPGFVRMEFRDPFNNRIEFLAKAD